MTVPSAPTARPHTTTHGDAFLAGGGRAAQLIRDRDWTGHPLGAPAQWSPEFKTALSLVLNSPESMILCWGPELHFFFNETYFPLLGPRLPWAMGARFDLVWAEAVEQAMPIIEAAMSGESRRFTDLPWKLGTDRGARDTWWTFSYSRVLDANGANAGLFIFTNETTQRVLADAALSESQQKLRALNESLEQRVVERTADFDRLWDTSADLLVVLGFDGVLRRVNRGWTEALGFADSELVGRHFKETLHPDDVQPTLLAHEDAIQGPRQVEVRMLHRDGGVRLVAWSAAPSNDLVYAIGRDITAQRAAETALRHTESQLRQAQKVEALGQLTGGVAHDFNNLLTVINGSAEMLARPNLAEERRAQCIAAITAAADRATRLTSQLLAFSRQQSLEPQVFEVGTQLESIGEMLRTLTGSRIEIALARPDTPLRIFADRAQFDVAIVNLALNARDAMAGVGRLGITAALVDERPAHRSLPGQAGRFVRIAIEDDGSGIAAEHLEQVFEPFFTTKGVGQGTGLGLSQVYGFTKQSGGEVLIDSRLGFGTTVAIYLPAAVETGFAAEDHIVAAKTPVPRPPEESRGTVLVVEDNPDVSQFTIRALGELGYRTVYACNGIEALQRIEETGARIDAVFSDVVMPGMSGLELLHAVRAQYPQLRMILTSGYSSVLAKTPESGVTLLRKPFSLQQLEKALKG